MIVGASGGANSLWLTEWLAEAMDLQAGMRVLDLGAGRASSSIFLHREFGVQVWSTDLWFNPADNLKRIRDAGADGGVFPIHAEARSLPYAAEFFDAIVAIDSYYYYGTDELFLPTLLRLVKPGGQLGIAGAALMEEIDGPVPQHLRHWWTPDMRSLHSAPWWRRHWERSGLLEVERAETMADGWQRWLDWQLAVAPHNAPEIQALEADRGQYLGYLRAVGRRRDVQIDEPPVAVQMDYVRRPLLREESP
jgi:cyclopropane fatty-acyl-phospholipid synthase-like methyltransferase